MSQRKPTVLRPGEGDKYWLVGDQLCIKLRGEQTGGAFAFAENYIVPGGGPPPHVHHREHELFVILEGSLQMGLGDALVTRSAGDAIFLPRGIPHVFKNVSDQPTRFLLVAAPCGFEAFTAQAGAAIDSIPCAPRTVGPADIQKLLAICPAHQLEILPEHRFTKAGPPAPKGKALWTLGQHVTILLRAEDTGGAASVAVVRSRPGPRVPPHSHRSVDEVFFVTEGTFRFHLDGAEIDAPKGTFIHVPAGIVHGFGALGGNAGLVDFHLPGGFERFFEECGAEAVEGSSPPDLPPPPPEVLKSLFERHGMDVPE